MGNRLNRLDDSILMAVPKPLLTEFDIHYRLESCAQEKEQEREKWSQGEGGCREPEQFQQL